MEDGQILFAKSNHTCFVKMVGDIRHRPDSGFDTFVKTLFDDETTNDVLLDLTDAVHLDSTNLGLLVIICHRMRTRFGRRATIVSTDDYVNEELDRMGFNSTFIMIHHPEHLDESFQEIPPVPECERRNAETILESHRALMEMNEENRAVFRDVVAALDEEVRAASRRDHGV